jgi:hypothetical protein
VDIIEIKHSCSQRANLSLQEWFAGLYAHTDVDAEPMSAGRQMGGHFGTRSLNPDGTWKDLQNQKLICRHFSYSWTNASFIRFGNASNITNRIRISKR